MDGRRPVKRGGKMAQQGGLDQISQAIGHLQAEVASAEKSRRMIHERLDRVEARLNEFAAVLSVLPTMRQELHAMASGVADYQKMKQRGIGVITLAGLGAGGIASGLAWVLSQFKT